LGGKSRHKSFPEEDSKKKIKNQSERIKQLEREIKRLKNELKTLNEAFKKSATYMSDESKLLKVEELIKAADKHQTLQEAKSEYMDKKVEAERTQQEIRDKWKAWAEKNRKIVSEEE
jgi:DNA repair exonuclease SbcCD ATPase subunit